MTEKVKSKQKWGVTKPFILASASPRRLQLLKNAGFTPAKVISADIDETEEAGEKPADYVARVSRQKALYVAHENPNICVLAADTIIVARGKIIRKAPNKAAARANLDLLSGGKHDVLTGYCLVSADGKVTSKVVRTIVTAKKFTQAEKDALIASGQWRNVAAYRIEGMLSALIKGIKGSYPNIIGLPIYEVAEDLKKTLK